MYQDQYYGTLISSVSAVWEKGKHIIFDIDVKGGLNIKNKFLDNCISIFIMPPSVEVLKSRLLKRGTEEDNSLKYRTTKLVHYFSLKYRTTILLL